MNRTPTTPKTPPTTPPQLQRRPLRAALKQAALWTSPVLVALALVSAWGVGRVAQTHEHSHLLEAAMLAASLCDDDLLAAAGDAQSPGNLGRLQFQQRRLEKIFVEAEGNITTYLVRAGQKDFLALNPGVALDPGSPETQRAVQSASAQVFADGKPRIIPVRVGARVEAMLSLLAPILRIGSPGPVAMLRVDLPSNQLQSSKHFYQSLGAALGAFAGLLFGGALLLLFHHRNVSRNMRILNQILSDELAALQVADARVRKLSRAVEASPVSVVITDQDARIEYVNPKFSELTGYTAEEALGQNPRLLKSGNTPAKTYENMWRTLLEHGQWHGELLNKKKNGDLFWELAHISALHDAQGRITHYVAVKQDITGRKQVEQELENARAKAEGASRAKAEFLANMSHEIRTPMNGVIGMTSLLEQTGLTVPQQEIVGIIRHSGEALLHLINDILDFSKIEAGKLELKTEAFSLRDCLRDALQLLAPKAAQKRLNLACLVGDTLPACCLGDHHRLRQILINLVGNAVKFTDQGEVTLKVDLAERSPEVTSPEIILHFQVHDTDPGITEAQQQRLFQMFSQVDTSKSRAHGGTGLGLAISRRLAEMMGGRMWVESRVNEGSTFHFTVRVNTQPESPAAPVADSRLAGKTVLLVSSSQTLRAMFQRAASANGFALHLAAAPAHTHDSIPDSPGVDLVVLETGGDPGRLAETIACMVELAPNARIALSDYRENLAQSSLPAEMSAAAMLPKPLFSFDLPQRLADLLAPAPVATAPARLPEENLAEQMPLRILLVDDNWINLRVGSGMLARYGYQAVMARDGLQALEQISLNQFDLVLLDVQMPHMDGYEVARQVTARFPEHRRPLMIAVTASAMQGDRERCLESGMCDFLAKPFKAAELQTMLVKWHPVVVKHRASADSGIGHALPLLPAPAPKSVSAVDFERLSEISEGDLEAMDEMVKLFEEQAAYLLEQMEAAWTERLPDQLSALAHKLKGSAGTCGINVMVNPLAAVEAAARKGNLEEAGRQLAHVRTGLTIAHESVGEHLKINGKHQFSEVPNRKN